MQDLGFLLEFEIRSFKFLCLGLRVVLRPFVVLEFWGQGLYFKVCRSGLGAWGLGAISSLHLGRSGRT